MILEIELDITISLFLDDAEDLFRGPDVSAYPYIFFPQSSLWDLRIYLRVAEKGR